MRRIIKPGQVIAKSPLANKSFAKQTIGASQNLGTATCNMTDYAQTAAGEIRQGNTLGVSLGNDA